MKGQGVKWRLVTRVLGLGHIAGAVMGDTRWNAGSRMMEAGHPDWWHSLQVDWRLVEDNTEAITKCRQAAQKAKKDKRCAITVKPVEP